MPYVTQRGDAAGLRQQLRDELAACLAPAGWSPIDGEGDYSMVLGAFLRPLSEEFAATVYLLEVALPAPRHACSEATAS
jgi:hypothetical protein